MSLNPIINQKAHSDEVKVGVLVVKPYVYSKDPKETDINKYEGIVADIWKEIAKKNPEKKFNYTFIHNNVDYENEVENIGKGKYDVLIGNLSVNEERSQFGDFTRTIFLNKLAIAYRTKLWDYVNMFKEMFVNVFIPTTVIIAITVILGVVFYYLNNRKMKFKNAMWITITSILGEPGILSMHPIEEKGRFHTAWVVFIVLFIGFFFNVLLYSVTTSSYLSNKVD